MKVNFLKRKNSYEIIKWEVEVGKQLLKQPTNLMPVHQFWELILQWANMQAEPADSLLKPKRLY
jgi:hypothetical protein